MLREIRLSMREGDRFMARRTQTLAQLGPQLPVRAGHQQSHAGSE
jgi:hypothetical protein